MGAFVLSEAIEDHVDQWFVHDDLNLLTPPIGLNLE